MPKIDPKIISDIGIFQEAYPHTYVIPMVSKGTSDTDRAVYDTTNIIEPRGSVTNYDWNPDKSEATLATIGAEHKVQKTGIGNVTGAMSGFSPEAQLTMFNGITLENGSYAYDFANFSANPMQLNFAARFTSGITLCRKFMNGKFDLPGDKVKAQDSKSAVATADNAFTYAAETASNGKSMYVAYFDSDDTDAIESWLTNPYPLADGVALTVTTITPANNAVGLLVDVEIKFSEAVALGSLQLVEAYEDDVALEKAAYTVTIKDATTDTIVIHPVAVGGWTAGDVFVTVPKSFAAKTGKALGENRVFYFLAA